LGKTNKNWAKIYKDEIFTQKNIKFTSKVVLFKETLEFKDAINLCYSRQTIILHSRIPIFQAWAMAQKMSKVLIIVVT
jgi:hypothetical protein